MNVETRTQFILNTLADVGVEQARTERQMHELQTLAEIGMRQIAALGTFPTKN
jgi:hypothetical protein